MRTASEIWATLQLALEVEDLVAYAAAKEEAETYLKIYLTPPDQPLSMNLSVKTDYAKYVTSSGKSNPFD